FVLAQALNEPHLASLACQLAFRCILQYGNRLTMSDAWHLWADRADEAAAPNTVDRARADNFLSNFAREIVGDEAEAQAYSRRAFELALVLNDAATVAESAGHALNGGNIPPEDHDERLRTSEA